MSEYVPVPVAPQPPPLEVKPIMASVEEAAAFLKLSKPKVYKMARLKQMPHRRFGATIRIPWSWLEDQGGVSL